MLPVFTTDNTSNHRLMHFVLFRKLCASYPVFCMTAAYFADFCTAQFRVYVSLTARCVFRGDPSGALRIPSLCHHVCYIFRMCASPKVIGVYTNAIITGVANEQPFRDRPICQLVGKPMSGYLLVADGKQAIPMVASATAPQPAPVGFLHFRPKPLN